MVDRVLESGLNLTAGPPAGGLEVVLSTAGAQVEGAVLDGSERPARGATVVLAPEARGEKIVVPENEAKQASLRLIVR